MTEQVEMSAQAITDDLVVEKMLAYTAYEAALTATAVPGATSDNQTNMTAAKVTFLQIEIPGNANHYVPWVTPGLDFQCITCGQAITADQEHPLHPEDEALLQAAKAKA